jgi:hypothetical protein
VIAQLVSAVPFAKDLNFKPPETKIGSFVLVVVPSP